MWVSYEEIRNHPPDFRVNYRFYLTEEGGRRNLPFQGYRSDFSYEGDDIKETGIYMIHPEFEDELGEVIFEDNIQVPQRGTARMWVLIPEMRSEIHKHRIKIGVKGYFMEGSKKVGEMEVIEIMGLYTNPEEDK
ncbi:hypothetical protein GZH47_22190 [Paenibacillus rhizovicinus]|uniref:Uncharacterized protein n=1 Tax=Paenibacillus rhizovicinus TaxID=2704463 RepID=A0A6C0P3Y3_9BACL|nr:hypothetical protein [Paenibacillus rhizovicinus]QHW33228.1 hypothetical protein GZH47_22190 [Paenibacillus rhizovicinus]